MPSKLSFLSLNTSALLMLMSLLSLTQTVAAQNPNANPHPSMENYWSFIYYIDDDNNPNTPPTRSSGGVFVSNQECQDERKEMLETGTTANPGVIVVAVDKCEMAKTTVYDTNKFCYTFSIEPKDPDSGLRPYSFNECRNTMQLCENERQGNIANLGRPESAYTITEISKCQNTKAN